MKTNVSGGRTEQPYSLRERVAQLETIVGDILRKLNQHPTTDNAASQVQRTSGEQSEQGKCTVWVYSHPIYTDVCVYCSIN